MSLCQQTDTQNILQHGESVWEYTKKLICGNFKEFKLPKWFIENHHFIVNDLHKWSYIKEYTLYHDCGKPYCLEIDSDGKRHFPNHAEISKQIYLEVFDNNIVSDLIGYDMIMHKYSFDQIKELNLDKKTLLTLVIVAFAEIHSNAEMFGGIESTSFKIKYKKLDRVGKKIIEYYEVNPHIDSYSYIIVRNDLSNAQKTVQSCHAIWEQSNRNYKHPSFVAVKVKNEYKLKQTMEKLVNADIQFSIFRDNIFNDEITALCTEPINGDNRLLLSKYQLIT